MDSGEPDSMEDDSKEEEESVDKDEDEEGAVVDADDDDSDDDENDAEEEVIDDEGKDEVSLELPPTDESTIGAVVNSGVSVPDSEMRWYEFPLSIISIYLVRGMSLLTRVVISPVSVRLPSTVSSWPVSSVLSTIRLRRCQ